MDGYLQTGIGIAVSILLFWLSYRQTIGAKKERTKNANKSLHRAVMRRMVLEDYTPKYKDISRVLEGKAREFNTSANDMLSEEQVLNSIYTEVFDSDLISPPQRIEIENRLDDLFMSIEEKPIQSQTSIQEYKIIREQYKKKQNSIILLTIAVSMVGASTSILYGFLKDPTTFITSNSEWIFSGVGVFIVSTAMITLMSIVKKEREEISSPSRSSAVLSATKFEIDIAKALEKSGYKYYSEQRVGVFRPDFIVDMDGKKVAIEAKAWGDVVPMQAMKRTIRMLEDLSKEKEVDSVMLITNKPIPLKGLYSENSKVKSYTMNEFLSLLKKK